MTVYSEEKANIPVGMGLDTFNHPANLQDGFCPSVTNMIARGDRLVTRKGFAPPTGMTLEATGTSIDHPNEHWYTQFPRSGSNDVPAFMFGGAGFSTIDAVSQSNTPFSSGADGEAQFTSKTQFTGGCVYLDRYYINTGTEILKIDAWDWNAETFTSTLITNTITGYGLFSFKDRLWCWDDTKIYYTQTPTSAGAYPEDWNSGNNFIVIGANQGLGKIYYVQPLMTKLLVFTATGLHSVSVLGSPANWVTKIIDNTIRVNTYACCYEYKGLVYFVDINGVWVTDGAEVKELSRNIKDVFIDKSTVYYEYYKLHQFEDGMLLCKIKMTDASPGVEYDSMEMYFTPLDFIAWTKFNIGGNVYDVVGGYSNVETKEYPVASSYLVLVIGTAGPSVDYKLVQYSGYQDNVFSANNVSGGFTSRIERAKAPFDIKRIKFAYLNLSYVGVDSALNIDYQWYMEKNRSTTPVNITDSVTAIDEGAIQLSADFFFRHIQSLVSFELSASITEYTLLGLSMVMHTHRKDPREVA